MLHDKFHRVTDLTSWTTLRCFTRRFLLQVHQFYTITKHSKKKFYFLFVCNDGKVYEGELEIVPKQPIDPTESFTELTQLRGLNLVTINSSFNLYITVITDNGDLYLWSMQNTFPKLIAQNVAKICFGFSKILVLYRDHRLVSWNMGCSYIYWLSGETKLIKGLPPSRGVTDIACHNYSLMAVAAKRGAVYLWGQQLNRSNKSHPTRFRLPAHIASPIAVAFLYVYTILLSTVSGACYVVDSLKTFQVLQVDPEDPIELIYTIPLEKRAFLVPRSGTRLYMLCLEENRLIRVVCSLWRTIPDMIALYGNYLNTVTLTTISPEALQNVEHFNDPFTCDMKFYILFKPYHYNHDVWKSDGRMVFVDKALLSARSTYLSLMIRNHWEREEKVKNFVETHRHPVYYSYLRYHHSGSLCHLEPDLSIELLQLAINFEETQLADQCYYFIQKHLTTEDFLRLYPCFKKDKTVENLFTLVPWCFGLHNFDQWFKLSLKHKDHELRQYVSLFVRKNFEQVIHHPIYRNMDLNHWILMMKISARVPVK